MSTTLLEVVTPDRLVLSHQVNMVSVHSGGGELGILPRHAPLAATVKPSIVRVKMPEGQDYIVVTGGFLEVRPDRVTILAETAELASRVDVDRAEAARKRAEQRLAERRAELNTRRAEFALQRAVIRLEAAELARQTGAILDKIF
jgi:F-type H+-transporting ATPase subunit epsilon